MSASSRPAVLIAEDDELLRMLTADVAEEAGFAAFEAGNADDAMAILESRSDVTLLLTDIDMPGSMDGLELAHAVHNRWPHLGIIIVSGQVDLAEHDLPPRSCFIAKPYRADQIISGLRSLAGH